MAPKATLENVEGYLLARAKGYWHPDGASRELQMVARAARERGYTRVLIDARGLTDPKSSAYRFMAGEDIAKFFGPAIKVAAIYPAELIDRLAEITAINRGARFIVVPEIDKALCWLLGDPTEKE